MDVRRVLKWIFGAFTVWWFLLGAPVVWYAWQDYFDYEHRTERARARCVEAVRAGAADGYVDELGHRVAAPDSQDGCDNRAAFRGYAVSGVWIETAFVAFFPLLIYFAGVIAGRFILPGAEPRTQACAR